MRNSSSKTMAFGGMMGAVAMVIIFLVNMFDTRVKNKEELVKRYGYPILGEIPGLDME